MTYTLRDEYPGFHHVVMRGNNKRPVFRDQQDRTTFLTLLAQVAAKQDWRVLAYALMVNHYHLVIEVGAVGMAAGMCQLNTRYARRFNAETGRVNHLFGRRYWNDRLEDDRRFQAAVRYVIQNPRRAGIPGPLSAHTWTSYPATIGSKRGPAELDRDRLLSLFGPTRAHALMRFVALCESPVPKELVRRQPTVSAP
jgi:REP-associated tyrosine transposase